MICPSCKCEYRFGVTECADCGVPLVDALDAAASARLENDRIVSVWSGNDPHECAAVREALEGAKIPFANPSTGYSNFPSLQPRMEVCVFSADEDRAKKVLLELEGRTDPDELTPEEIESLALPASDDADSDEGANTPADLHEEWDEDEAVSEVWNGEQEDFANTLSACFRENGIASRKLTEGGRWRLVVRSEHEARATEIVREVVEASPPA
jgi:uncharacterized protein YrzB (UPF0473 family)